MCFAETSDPLVSETRESRVSTEHVTGFPMTRIILNIFIFLTFSKPCVNLGVVYQRRAVSSASAHK